MKLKQSAVFITCIFFLILSPLNNPYAQENGKFAELNLIEANTDDHIQYFSADIKDLYHPRASSNYPSANLFDGSFNTCWVAGNSKTARITPLYVKLPEKIEINKAILNIFPGYGKSITLYHQNSRPEKIKLSVYAAIEPDGYTTEVADTFFIKKYSIEKTIELKDHFEVQSFPLNLDKNKLLKFKKSAEKEYKMSMADNQSLNLTSSFILKIEITDYSRGSKYADICISEIFFNNKFITPSPRNNKDVIKVYIKNDNSLIADYHNDKGVVVLKDPNSIFTMVDWENKENFAILHYVPNDESGHGRTEELYSLVDLKNRKIVDKEFERCTGYSPLFGILEKQDDRVFIGNIGEFNIELK